MSFKFFVTIWTILIIFMNKEMSCHGIFKVPMHIWICSVSQNVLKYRIWSLFWNSICASSAVWSMPHSPVYLCSHAMRCSGCCSTCPALNTGCRMQLTASVTPSWWQPGDELCTGLLCTGNTLCTAVLQWCALEMFYALKFCSAVHWYYDW